MSYFAKTTNKPLDSSPASRPGSSLGVILSGALHIFAPKRKVLAPSKDKCVDCIEHKRCRDSNISWLFFGIGIVATIAIRIVTILMDINPLYAKTAWYIGISGFFIFFLYKYQVNQARYNLIRKRNLLGRVMAQEKLDEEENRLIGAILCGISSKKERMNFFFIFISSLITLIWALYVDFFK